MNFQTIIGIGLGMLIVAIVMSTTTWEVQEVETYFTHEPYTYEQSLVRVKQIRKFPWIYEVTQVQYIVKNTDVKKGTFVLNFIFDNGAKIETRTKTVDIQLGYSFRQSFNGYWQLVAS